MHPRWQIRLMTLAALLGGWCFQATGCNALSDAGFIQMVNAGTQQYINSIFTQFVTQSIDGLFNVN
ncbi:MAG: hypothetical protein HJJLKODD_02438 [Phycisphaerae bacterium]|nr:hypothetical protein [Phycisphaerae bacterium]